MPYQSDRRMMAKDSVCPDPRWRLLSLVQQARELIGLKDRDLTVLRGLLSLIPADRWGSTTTVHASNRTLQERCDGIDERTLRRRLARLCELGLIIRRQSPNRKRYQVRDENGAVLIAYGFDLAPLHDGHGQLEAMAAEQHAETRRIAALKGQLRHALYLVALNEIPPETCDLIREAERVLRRKATSTQVREILASVTSYLSSSESTLNHPVLTDADGQNDRQSQSSKQESYERRVETTEVAPQAHLTAHQCIEAVPEAIAFSQATPQSWRDLMKLSDLLAPALGISHDLLSTARSTLGANGTILAILGMVQAGERIKRPTCYLQRLTESCAKNRLNLTRMFRSLTRAVKDRFPAGNYLPPTTESL